MADIFVSYASQDRDAAFRIVSFLEEQGISCWVAPRDVPPGVEYGEAIINGIETSRALVLILSDQSNDSMFVRKEVERAVSKTKPVLPVRIREVTPSGSLEYFISSAQWVDAWKSPMEQHLLPLVGAIKALGRPGAAPARSAPPPQPRGSRMPLLAGTGLGLAFIAAAGAWWYAARTPATTAPVASAPSAAATPAAPAGTKRDDLAFLTGSWCQPYQGMTIRYEIMRTGPDTILTRVDHPQSPAWEVPTRIKRIEDGFEFQPVDAAPDDKNIARFTIVDDSTMKLVRAEGKPQDGPIRVRCATK
jgi:hypothetical protein